MATFEAQVESLASIAISGSSTPNQTQLTQFLTDGAKEIINSLPKSLLEDCADVTTLNGSSPKLTLVNQKGLVLAVLRNDQVIDQPCRFVSTYLRGKVQDSSEMDFATKTDPAYLIYNNELEVYPVPDDTESATVLHVVFPSVAFDSDAISRFPSEAEYLVVIYATIKSLEALYSGEEDIELYIPIINQLKEDYKSGLAQLVR
jgi:broad specificity polyphosphatase/5'/3'-nucleotidase SurE